jgi:hypothetical protein
MNGNNEIGFYGGGIYRIPPSRRMKPIAAKRRRALMISVLIACTAIIIASWVGLTSPSKNDGSQSKVPTGISAPGPPYFVIGFTLDAIGNPSPNCQVNITDKSTGDWDNSTLSDSNGYYDFDLNSLAGGYQIGDLVNATAYNATSIGWNETTLTNAPHLWLNVTMNGTIVIPEFTNIAMPMVGALSIFIVAMVASRSNRGKRS